MSTVEMENDRWPFVNDWPNRRFFILAVALIAIIACFVTTIFLVGDGTPINYIGYLLVPFLLFIPGGMILKCARLHDLGLTRSAFYALALSILLMMVVGFCLNLLNIFGIMQRPLTVGMIATAYLSVLVALTFVAIKRDKTHKPLAIGHVISLEGWLMIAFAVLMPLVVFVAAQWGASMAIEV